MAPVTASPTSPRPGAACRRRREILEWHAACVATCAAFILIGGIVILA